MTLDEALAVIETLQKRLAVFETREAEWRTRLSRSKMGHAVSAEQRAKQAATMKRVVKSPEWLAKLAAANRARKGVIKGPMSPETRAKISTAKMGKKLSPEHRANVAAATQKRWDEYKKTRPAVPAPVRLPMCECGKCLTCKQRVYRRSRRQRGRDRAADYAKKAATA